CPDDTTQGPAHQTGRYLHSLRRQAETDCIDHEVFAFDEAEPSQFIEQGDIMRCIALARKQGAEAIDACGLLPLGENGHVAAAPPSSVMKSRRFTDRCSRASDGKG